MGSCLTVLDKLLLGERGVWCLIAVRRECSEMAVTKYFETSCDQVPTCEYSGWATVGRLAICCFSTDVKVARKHECCI